MEKPPRRWWLATVLMVVPPPLVLLEAPSEEMPMLVGYLSYSEGWLSRYNPEERDWVAIAKDSPLEKGGILSSDKREKAGCSLFAENSLRTTKRKSEKGIRERIYLPSVFSASRS